MTVKYKEKEMNLAYAGLFNLSDLFDLASYEYEKLELISKIWVTEQQAEHLSQELLALGTRPKIDDRPQLVKHMYPKKHRILVEVIHGPFNDIKVGIEA